MKFLKRLLTALEGYIQSKKNAMDLNRVQPHEPIARFLLQKNNYSISKKTVKPVAFLPNPSNLETSVFRIMGLTDNDIWNIGETYVTGPQGKNLHGHGVVIIINIQNLGLFVIPDNVPDRHANITGWPVEKDKQLSIAQELAAIATLKLKN